MSTELAQYLDFANHHGNATMADIERLYQGVVLSSIAFMRPLSTRAIYALQGKSLQGQD